MFNDASGMNSDTGEARNMVTVVQGGKEEAGVLSFEGSDLVAKLDTTSVPYFVSDSISVSVIEIDVGGSERLATAIISLTLGPTTAPTPAPSTSKDTVFPQRHLFVIVLFIALVFVCGLLAVFSFKVAGTSMLMVVCGIVAVYLFKVKVAP